MNHIYSSDGLIGCYRGFGFILCGNLLGTYVSCKMIEYKKRRMLTTDSKNTMNFWCLLRDDIVNYMITLSVTYPFHVLCTRSIAEYAGREIRYSANFFSSFWNQIQDCGLAGFYSGFSIRLLGGLLSISVTTLATYFLTGYFYFDSENQKLVKASFSVIF